VAHDGHPEEQSVKRELTKYRAILRNAAWPFTGRAGGTKRGFGRATVRTNVDVPADVRTSTTTRLPIKPLSALLTALCQVLVASPLAPERARRPTRRSE
jgi:hypothetical protein